MSVMGYRDTIDLGNMMNSNIASANRNIAFNNSIARSNFKANLLGEENKLEGMKEQEMQQKAEDRGIEGSAIGKTLSDAGDMAKLGIKRYKQGKATLGAAGRVLGVAGAIPQGEDFASRTPLGAVGESARNTNPLNSIQLGTRDSLVASARGPLNSAAAVLPGGESDADVNAVLDFGDKLGGRVVAPSGVPSSAEGSGIADRVPEVSGGGSSGDAAPTTLTEMRQQAEAAETSAPRASAGVEPLSIPKEEVPDMPEASGLGKLGKGLAGISAVEGAYDLYNDATAKTGTWGKKKGYEQVGDVANITGGVAGALELAGVGLDATGFGLPVGLAVGAIGAAAGATSFGADLYGDTKKEKTMDKGVASQQQAISNMKSQGPTQQKPMADRVLGTTGSYVGGA